MTTNRERFLDASAELALHLGQGIRREGRTFYVPSRTRGGMIHRIDLAYDGALICNCEASAFGRECWAVKAVREEINMTEETALTVAPLQLQRPVSLIPSDNELSRMERVAAIILAGGIDLPKELDTPQKIMSVMLKGRALGLDPAIAIDHIHYIDGRAVPDAQIMAGILYRDCPGAKLIIEHEEPEVSCTMRLILPSRGIDASYTVTTSDADVKTLIARDTPHQARGRDGSNYTTKPGAWVQYPRDRLRWHAQKRLLKVYAPDVINGLAAFGIGDYTEEPEMVTVKGARVERATGEIVEGTVIDAEPEQIEKRPEGEPTRSATVEPPTPAPAAPDAPQKLIDDCLAILRDIKESQGDKALASTRDTVYERWPASKPDNGVGFLIAKVAPDELPALRSYLRAVQAGEGEQAAQRPSQEYLRIS